MPAPEDINSNPNFFLRKRVVFIIFFLAINILNAQSILAHRINVWDIFYRAYFHLTEHKNLYLFYPAEYFDEYLYSPSFAVLFAPFSKLPYYVAYFLWNNLSMMIIPFMAYRLPLLSDRKKALFCYIVLIEFLTCLQGTQTNAMIAGMILCTFLSFEKKQYWLAAFLIAIGFYIKIFPLAAASLFLLYPDKIRFLIRFVTAMVVIGALPLLFIPYKELIWQYHNWAICLHDDQHANYGVSIPGLIGANFGITDIGKICMQVLGIFIFLTMYIRTGLFKEYRYRVYFFCALMMWMPLFNHAAEIYSYAIAIIGVATWYAYQPRNKWLDRGILLFIFLASVTPIDPMPKAWSYFVREHNLKVIPYMILFAVVLGQMLFNKSTFFRKEIKTD